ncbi:2-C-methyl-D-erythritol 2,4-cyclodiphosphate synthase [Candidatus Omnitrophota bacterium]
MSFRVGFGYDIHKLTEGRKLILGGVEIPHAKGLVGHSDADVLMHAIIDALLGAVGKKDIGKHFPDTDETYANISSAKLLKETSAIVMNAQHVISNIDATIVAEAPNLSSFREKMQAVIAKTLTIEEDCVNIKATTNEGFGPIGKQEAIVAYAVALLTKK